MTSEQRYELFQIFMECYKLRRRPEANNGNLIAAEDWAMRDAQRVIRYWQQLIHEIEDEENE